MVDTLAWDDPANNKGDSPNDNLRRLNARHQLLLHLLEGQRLTSDPDTMMAAAAEAVCRYLGADRVGFFEMEHDDELRFGSGWAGGRLPLLTGRFPVAGIGARYLAQVRLGKTLGISDTRIDPLTADSVFGEIGAVALIGAPIFREGRWRAGLYVHHSEPRAWRDDEISLIREVADQTWDAVERARVQAALRKSEERLSFALEAGGAIGAWDWDVPSDRVYANAQFAEFFSVDPTRAATGAPISDFLAGIYPEDRARVAASIQEAIATGANYTEEYRILQQDNSVRWVLARGRCHLRAGVPVRFPGVVFDITDRKRAEQQLREQWYAFDTALSNTPDFTYTFDLDGRFTYVNRALLSLWQKPLSEAVGKNFFDLEYPLDLAERLQRQIQQVIDTRQTLRDTTPYTGAAGEERLYEYIFVPVLSANGEVEAVAGSTRDITEQRLSEERERERQEQFRENARLESLGVMAGGIAHDFNNLLVAILGNASLLTEIAPEKCRLLAEDIVLAAERAADLTSQMLAYSGRGQFVLEDVDLVKLIRDNLTLLRASIPRNVTMELDLGSGQWVVEADRGQMQQIVMNLLINASEAIGDSPGVIRIRISSLNRTAARLSERLHTRMPPGYYVTLEIGDNGCGMTHETQKRIFDPFFTTKFTGRGLGLAAVLGIVKGHHGDIEVVSEPGAGATFTVLLPARKPAAAVIEEPESAAPDIAGGLTVLVIDDEEIILRTVSSALKSRGYNVLTASNGSEAFDLLLKGTEVALVILDLTMPVLTGEQMVPMIRSARPEIPIILSSGYSEAEIQRRFTSSGIAGVLQKPYNVDGLVSKIKGVLQAQSAKSGAQAPA
jgi:two-component system cell cycle sensor histidine kinase/response regulator CckA